MEDIKIPKEVISLRSICLKHAQIIELNQKSETTIQQLEDMESDISFYFKQMIEAVGELGLRIDNSMMLC